MSNLSVPNKLSQTERTIIVDHLRRITSCEERRVFEIDLPNRLKMICKHDDDILNEASTQQFFYSRAKDDTSAPRIPEVFDAFSCDQGDIMVMEKLDALTLSEHGLSEESAVKYAAFAVGWLLDQLPWVPESCFGRISSDNAPVLHRFFKDHEAPGIFSNCEELASFVLKASGRIPKGQRYSIEDIIVFFGEARRIYHSDIKKENFLLDSTNKVCIIDFQHIGIFPKVFQTYSFFNIGVKFAASVGRELGFKPSSDANRMKAIAVILLQSYSRPWLGNYSDSVNTRNTSRPTEFGA
ncbi:hypothetical protein BKA70DRAFT_1178802 [Coprinopsis sp. MPI-PUGE-AT-0042]|nr:hypothetical protein BKA70DRAFT_1178802 [Coprinopsis sp. MPI-PUGE-AT-0042]